LCTISIIIIIIIIGRQFTDNLIVRKLTFWMSCQPWHPEFLDVKNYKWRLSPVWHRMLYSCTHMATVGIEGLRDSDWVWMVTVLLRVGLSYGSRHRCQHSDVTTGHLRRRRQLTRSFAAGRLASSLPQGIGFLTVISSFWLGLAARVRLLQRWQIENTLRRTHADCRLQTWSETKLSSERPADQLSTE